MIYPLYWITSLKWKFHAFVPVKPMAQRRLRHAAEQWTTWNSRPKKKIPPEEADNHQIKWTKILYKLSQPQGDKTPLSKKEPTWYRPRPKKKPHWYKHDKDLYYLNYWLPSRNTNLLIGRTKVVDFVRKLALLTNPSLPTSVLQAGNSHPWWGQGYRHRDSVSHSTTWGAVVATVDIIQSTVAETALPSVERISNDVDIRQPHPNHPMGVETCVQASTNGLVSVLCPPSHHHSISLMACCLWHFPSHITWYGDYGITTINKYIGVIFDEFLDYTKTATMLAESDKRSLGGIFNKYKINWRFGYSTYTKLQESCVIPTLDYCSSVWGYNVLDKINTIQKRAIRLFLGMHRFAANKAINADMWWVSCRTRRHVNMLRLWNKLITMDNSWLVK